MSGWGDALVQTRPANARAEVARSGWPATTTSSALTASPDFLPREEGKKAHSRAGAAKESHSALRMPLSHWARAATGKKQPGA